MAAPLIHNGGGKKPMLVKIYLSDARIKTLKKTAQRRGLDLNHYCSEVVDNALAERCEHGTAY